MYVSRARAETTKKVRRVVFLTNSEFLRKFNKPMLNVTPCPKDVTIFPNLTPNFKKFTESIPHCPV